MKKICLLVVSVFTLVHAVNSQNVSLERFQASLYRKFLPIEATNTDTCFVTFFLLVAEVGTTYTISNICFSDNASSWQKKELERIKHKLDLDALKNYARENEFTGKLLFPFFHKREAPDCNFLQTSINEYDPTFLINNKPLSGNVRFEKPMVLKIVSVKTKR